MGGIVKDDFTGDFWLCGVVCLDDFIFSQSADNL